MNIDFNQDPGFSTYVLLLMFSGVVMLGLSGVGRSSKGLRALNAIFGLGFVGYGFYLAFVFQGGSYVIFFKAFILPAVMIFKTVQSWMANRRAAAAPPAVPTPASEGEPTPVTP